MTKTKDAIIFRNEVSNKFLEKINKATDECIELLSFLIEKIEPSKWSPDLCYDSVKNVISIKVTNDFFDDNNILAKTNPFKGEIVLNNSIFDNNDTYYLNDNEIDLITLILLTQSLHTLCKGWGEYSLSDNVKYKGYYGLEEYKVLLDEYLYDSSNIDGIPIEYIFGEVSEETVLKKSKGDDFYYINSDINGIVYPRFKNDILNGFINKHNYISTILAGILQDVDGNTDQEFCKCWKNSDFSSISDKSFSMALFSLSSYHSNIASSFWSNLFFK